MRAIVSKVEEIGASALLFGTLDQVLGDDLPAQGASAIRNGDVSALRDMLGVSQFMMCAIWPVKEGDGDHEDGERKDGDDHQEDDRDLPE
ncbi:hypothetical protein [Pseudoxanthomonas composti]|uniref:Uncharacterized protein n=1 Tax=Pseudoxanthomonas composti TaxID=2137479 RepID=A0A4Q1JX12_9GAMM|nr:hypothetical protein [Pseudoxanthomonas composti]RXR07184.1 hypothetical protein EPA99_04490 [Pseudoxanthomonas composti]